MESCFTLIPAFVRVTSFLPGYTSPQEIIPLLIIISLFIGLITLVKTNFGLSLLIFSMLLSPELETFKVPSQSVVFRFDDFLIGAVFFTWLAKMAIFKETALFRHTPINLPSFLYIVACSFSTLLGAEFGIVTGRAPFFFILKYFEYFLLFFMFSNNVETQKQVQNFFICFFITAIIVCAYGNGLYITNYGGQYATQERITAPFEGDNPQHASLSGYLLLLISLLLGLLSYSEWPRHRWFLWCFLCACLATLVLSRSRGALIGFIPLYLTAIFLATKRRRIHLVLFIGMIFLVGYFTVPGRVLEFIKEGFVGHVYKVVGVNVSVGETGAVRFFNWRIVFEKWVQHPIFGCGVTGVGIVDNQYLRVLGEAGIVGVIIFIWMLVTIFRVGFSALKRESCFSKALGMALVCTNVGLMAQGLTANSYIIVRIMEPFWFLLAMTVGVTQFPEAELSAAKKAA